MVRNIPKASGTKVPVGFYRIWAFGQGRPRPPVDIANSLQRISTLDWSDKNDGGRYLVDGTYRRMLFSFDLTEGNEVRAVFGKTLFKDVPRIQVDRELFPGGQTNGGVFDACHLIIRDDDLLIFERNPYGPTPLQFAKYVEEMDNGIQKVKLHPIRKQDKSIVREVKSLSLTLGAETSVGKYLLENEPFNSIVTDSSGATVKIKATAPRRVVWTHTEPVQKSLLMWMDKSEADSLSLGILDKKRRKRSYQLKGWKRIDGEMTIGASLRERDVGVDAIYNSLLSEYKKHKSTIKKGDPPHRPIEQASLEEYQE